MNDLFLTKEQLIDMTGYQYPSCQIRVLREHGVKFFVSRSGHPKVPVSEINNPKETVLINENPDFAALEKVS